MVNCTKHKNTVISTATDCPFCKLDELRIEIKIWIEKWKKIKKNYKQKDDKR